MHLLYDVCMAIITGAMAAYVLCFNLMGPLNCKSVTNSEVATASRCTDKVFHACYLAVNQEV
jgi:hypothetical protein